MPDGAYPKLCSNNNTGCSSDADCEGGGTCASQSGIKISENEEIRDVICGKPTPVPPNQSGGDAGPPSDGGLIESPDGGLPVVACLYIVCADVDNEVLEWDKAAASRESNKSNCTCYSDDTELAENECPL